jgi:hypothetical protein
MVVVVVMPLMSIVFLCHKVIETPQYSSKAVVDTSNGCLNCPKLGVGGKLCGLQHINLLIGHLYISINYLSVLLHARGLWWRVLVIIHRTCHGEVHNTKKTTSEEEQKKALGCSCCKTLTLNLLTQALTSSYLASQDGEGDQQVSNPVKLQWGYMWSYRWLKVIDKEVLAPR